MISAELQKAIDALQIEDVYVRQLEARCVGDFDPKYFSDFGDLHLQYKHWVRESAVAEEDEADDRLLRVFLELGVRWIDPAEQVEEKSIRAFIEAEFVAEYRMVATLEKPSIDEFALKNASYHVWPYWRELVSTQCARMHLPRVVLPTMQLAHNRHIGASSSEDQRSG